MEYSNVFAIYNTVLQKVVQVVVDAQNPEDPCYMYPDCIKVPIDAVVYGTMELNQATADFIDACCKDVEAQMQL